MVDKYSDANKEIWHVFTGHKDKLYEQPTPESRAVAKVEALADQAEEENDDY